MSIFGQRTPLDSICEFIIDCEHKTAPIQKEGYPSIRTPNIGRGRLILDGVNRVSEDTYTRWTQRAIPRNGDLILAREAPVGNVAIIPKNLKVCLGQRTVLIRPDKSKVDANYLVYLLLGDEVQGKIHSLTAGATVAHLNMGEIRKMELPPLPPLPVQHKIAAILSAYDDLIENNTQRIKILEEMAQAIYREWFVHFRFPGNEGVQMVESEMGLIPEGWEVCLLKSIAEINTESIKQGNEPGKIGYIDITSVSTGSIDSITWMHFTDAPGRARRIVRHGDVIWSMVRPNRKSYCLTYKPEPNTIVSTGFAVIRAKKVPFSFLYQKITTDDFVSYLTNHATGAAYPAVKTDDFENAKIVKPDGATLIKFHEFVEPIYEIKSYLSQKNANLRRTRDLLIPKLISGELDVSELDIMIPEAMT